MGGDRKTQSEWNARVGNAAVWWRLFYLPSDSTEDDRERDVTNDSDNDEGASCFCTLAAGVAIVLVDTEGSEHLAILKLNFRRNCATRIGAKSSFQSSQSVSGNTLMMKKQQRVRRALPRRSAGSSEMHIARTKDDAERFVHFSVLPTVNVQLCTPQSNPAVTS